MFTKRKGRFPEEWRSAGERRAHMLFMNSDCPDSTLSSAGIEFCVVFTKLRHINASLFQYCDGRVERINNGTKQIRRLLVGVCVIRQRGALFFKRLE